MSFEAELDLIKNADDECKQEGWLEGSLTRSDASSEIFIESQQQIQIKKDHEHLLKNTM